MKSTQMIGFIAFLGIIFLSSVMLGGDYQYTVKKLNKTFTFTEVEHEFMVKYDHAVVKEDYSLHNDVVSSANLETVHDAVDFLGYAVYKVSSGQNLEEALTQVAGMRGVVAVHQSLRDHEGFIKYFIPEEMTIQFDAAIGEARMLAVLAQYGLSIKTDHWTPGYYTVYTPSDSDVFELIRQFNSLTEVEFSELNVVSFNDFAYTPNDTFYGQQWSWNNVGQNGGTPDADMDVDDAWDIEQGDPDVLIGIIDTGVDWDHEDLQANIWQNPGEDTDGDGTMIWNGSNWVLDPDDLNGIDDDSNGQVDDLIGWDFGSGDLNPDDDGSHGTACAGIAAAVTDNNLGVAGVAGGSRIMPLRVSLISGQNANRADAINYAASFINDYHGIVLSCSWIMSSGDFSAVENAIIDAKADGVVCMFAAGNFNSSPVSYPARYEQSVAVGGTSPCDERKSTSSCDGEFWGASFGDDLSISAPCVLVYTTDRTGSAGYSPTNYYSSFNGTSSACPNAAGVAALIISHYAELTGGSPQITPDEVQEIMEITADKVGGYNYNYDPSRPGASFELGYGRLNADAALAEVIARYGGGGIDCADVRDLRARCQAGNTLQSMLRFWNNDYDGTSVTFVINGSDTYVRPVNNDRARLSLAGYGAGVHSIEVTEVDHCVGPVTANCSGVDDLENGMLAESEVLPENMQLIGNYPNPFNPTTQIQYALNADAAVSIKVYNSLGQEVATLIDGYQEAGFHSVQWDGRNNAGVVVSSGIYLYRMETEGFTHTQKMLLTR